MTIPISRRGCVSAGATALRTRTTTAKICRRKGLIRAITTGLHRHLHMSMSSFPRTGMKKKNRRHCSHQYHRHRDNQSWNRGSHQGRHHGHRQGWYLSSRPSPPRHRATPHHLWARFQLLRKGAVLLLRLLPNFHGQAKRHTRSPTLRRQLHNLILPASPSGSWPSMATSKAKALVRRGTRVSQPLSKLLELENKVRLLTNTVMTATRQLSGTVTLVR